MPAPARDAAFRVLRTIASGRGDLGDALSRARDPLQDARDRALTTELATGTLRWRGALDYQLQRFSARPLEKLDGAVLDALRLGAYQLLHLERVPTSAVVNDSVDLVKRAGVRSAAGFANAILRRLAREREALTWPARDDLAYYFSVVHSHPVWLVRRWIERHGDAEAETWLRFNNEPPALTLAANRLLNSRDQLIDALTREGMTPRPAPVAPHGVIVDDRRVLSSAAFRGGRCVVQDEASQIIPELVTAARGSRVLDLCASPGGKTIALAAQVGRDGRVIACDVRTRRVRLLHDTMSRCRMDNVHVVHIQADGPVPFRPAGFDCVLIDAPCSGLGTVRRDPDIRWRRTPDDFSALASAQRELLRRARTLVKPGGRLVYSTCSSEPEENEDVVAGFLDDASDFAVVPLSAAGVPSVLAPMQTPGGYLRTSPAHGLEPFFGAVLQRSPRP